MSTVYEAYRRTKRELEAHCVEDAAWEAQLLTEFVCGVSRQRLLLCGETEITQTQSEQLSDAVAQRAAGRPLQYILGEWEFCGSLFSVGEGVLIPREETALLVEAVKDFCRGKQAPRILDLCAGSGAIAVSCAKAIPNAVVTACEWSREALHYLQKNAARHRTAVEILARDILLPQSTEGILPQDVIVSNPPYIPSADLPTLQREVQREPQMALDGGEDGLLFYRALLSVWLPLLKEGGLLAVECGIRQAHTIEQMFLQCGLTVRIQKDFAGIERIVCGQKQEK